MQQSNLTLISTLVSCRIGPLIDFEWDYHEAPLDFGNLGVPVNSPSAADNLGGIATDLGVERTLCVSTLTD